MFACAIRAFRLSHIDNDWAAAVFLLKEGTGSSFIYLFFDVARGALIAQFAVQVLTENHFSAPPHQCDPLPQLVGVHMGC